MIGIEGWEIARITEADRARILGILGLERYLFAYQERVGSQILRSWMVEGANSEAFFPAATGDAAQAGDLPLLVRTHLNNQLAETPLFPALALWDELIPFPFRLWGAAATPEASGGLESSDRVWLQAGRELAAIFQNLHERLTQAEISLLTLVPVEGESVTLFFHCVRRRFLTLGRLAAAEPLSESSSLAHLGATFQRLTVAIPSVAGTLEDQVAGIRQAVETAIAAEGPTRLDAEPAASAPGMVVPL